MKPGMQTKYVTSLKFKAFSADPQWLQDFADFIRNEFRDTCIVSKVQAAQEGDWFLYVTVYKREVV